MSENSLRTKITDLPLCEDTDLIDTLIAIGKDGKTYRVNSEDVFVGGGGTSAICEPIIYYVQDREIRANFIDNPNLRRMLTTGGILHLTVNVCNSNLDIPIIFDEDSMFAYDTYGGKPVYKFNSSVLFLNELKDGETGAVTNKFQIFNIHGTLGSAFIGDKERYFWIDCDILDLETKETDLNTTFVVSNFYFEPRRIPASRIKKYE